MKTLGLLLLIVGFAFIGILTAAQAAFDVASVKVNRERVPTAIRTSPIGIDYIGVPLLVAIAEAYQVPSYRVTSRAPLSERYDIIARADREVPKEELMAMLQTLLADRFKLALHTETRVDSLYRLVLDKDGPKNLEESTTVGGPVSLVGPGAVQFKNHTMPAFAEFLTARLSRPVLDQTALQGTYDFILRVDVMEILAGLANRTVSPDEVVETKKAISNWTSSSVFKDIQELGLKLEADKGPVKYLVIDHVESPSEN